MPCGGVAVAMGVDEGEGARQTGVVVDYVGEVGEGFTAFVDGGEKGRGGEWGG